MFFDKANFPATGSRDTRVTNKSSLCSETLGTEVCRPEDVSSGDMSKRHIEGFYLRLVSVFLTPLSFSVTL